MVAQEKYKNSRQWQLCNYSCRDKTNKQQVRGRRMRRGKCLSRKMIFDGKINVCFRETRPYMFEIDISHL